MRSIKFSLILCLGGILLISGCGKKTPDETQNNNNEASSIEEILSRASLDDELKKMLESTKSPAREATSHDKIQAALEAGEISKEEAVTKSIKASFLPDEVEEEYKGAESSTGRTSLNRDLQWAINNWDSLDDKTKKELEPYVVSPDDPKYFENVNKKTSFNFIKPAKAIAGMSGPLVFSTTWFEGAGKIYYWEVDKVKAERIKTAMGKAWPMYKALLGMYPDNHTKIYYTHTGSDYGMATWKDDYCEIKIGNNHPEKYIEPVLAHELFHCFQYYLSSTYIESTPGSDWITEATAVWAEDFVYPEKNSEFDHLDEFYDSLHKYRLSIENDEEYGSYMWFFFLSQYLGNDSHVNTVLQKGKNGNISDAVRNSISNFDNTYAEFAMYNWNQVPWEIYQDTPKYPDKNPTGDSTQAIYLYDKVDKDVPIALDLGGMKYIYHYFDSDLGRVNRVKFDFKSPTLDPSFQRQALIKIGDTWHREDWNSISEKEYCRKDEAERVKAVILVYSNADLEWIQSGVYNIDTKGDCVVKKKGHMKLSFASAGGGKTIKSTLELDETVEYDLDGGNYIVTERKANCNSVDTASADMEWMGYLSSTIFGNGNITESYEVDGNNDIRFDINDDGKSGYILTGLNAKEDAWATRVTVIEGVDDGPAEKGGCGGFWASRYELKPEEIFADKIKGKRIMAIPGGSMEIEFEYDLP
ncbi:MAG: DUF2089 domain-containing protein [Bacteroidales bacterium]|nr:DUF2089 domain-containing protein [Bacteroidales bacterium]